MSEDRMTTLFFELFTNLPRQGPGGVAHTLQALALVPHVGPETRILDLGCGTGMQTIALAQNTRARIVAVDRHVPYLEELEPNAAAVGVADRIETRAEDMGALSFPDESFDLIWCEGAIYAIGFETGLRAWRRLLAPGGHLAVTEVCWTRPDVPPECAAFWQREYPAIRELPELLQTIETCGYELAGHFPLPPSAWWDEYYGPLERNLAAFRERHQGEADAEELADGVQREIDMWRKYAEYYGYEFFVMRC